MKISRSIRLGMAISLASILLPSGMKAADDVAVVDFVKSQEAKLTGTVLQKESKLEYVKEADGKTVAKIHYLMPVHEKEVPTVGIKFPDKNGQPDKAVILTAPVKVIKVDVQGDLSGKILCMAFRDDSGEFSMFHLDPLAEKSRPGWTTMVADLTKPAFFAWGGDGNKLIEYPAALDSIYLDGWGTKAPTEGEYKLDNIRMTPVVAMVGDGKEFQFADFAKYQNGVLGGEIVQKESKLEYVKEADGTTSAKVHYLFPIHDKAIPVVGIKFPHKVGQTDKALILDNPAKTIKIDVQGDLSEKFLCMWMLDDNGEACMYHFEALPEKPRPGWTTMSVDLTKPAFFAWGGDNNKMTDFPAAIDAIYLDGFGTKSPTEGEYKLQDIRVVPFAGVAGSGIGAPITVVADDFENDKYCDVMTWGAVEKPSGLLKMAEGNGDQGKKYAELSYSFAKDANTSQVVSLSFEGNPFRPYFKGPVSSLSVDVKGDGTTHSLGFTIIDKTGEFHQYGIGATNIKEWKTFTVDLTKPANGGSWGGNNNKRLDYPIFIRCINIGYGKGQAAEGTIGIDNVCVVTSESPDNFLRVRLDLGRETPFFWGEKDAPGKANLVISCLAKATAKGKFSLKLMDRRYEATREIFKGDVEAEYGKPFVKDIDLSVPRMGVYPIEIEAGAKKFLTSFAWLKPYVAEPWKDSPFGINGEEDFELMKKLGINWPRIGLYWRLIEARQGKWSLNGTEPKIKEAKAAGLEAMVMLADWGPEQNYGTGKSPADQASWDAFGNFCGTVVKKHSSQIKDWQIWNEPNLSGFWLPQAKSESYVGMLKAAYEVIKKADPEAKVMGGVLSCVDVEYAEEMLKLGAGKYMDVLSIHPYHLPEAPEMLKKGIKSATLSDKFVEGTFVEQMDNMNALFKKYGCEKKMWIDEYGYAPHPELFPYFSHPEWKSGALTIRQSLLALSLPYVERLFPFNWKDMVTPAMNWDHVTGFVRKDDSPRAVCVGYSTMARMLDRTKFSKKLDFGKDVYALEFAGEGGKVAAVWVTKGGTTLSAKLAEGAVVCDLMGNETSLVPNKSLVSFGVCEEPVFISYKGNLEPAAPQIKFGMLQCAPGDSCEIEIKADGTLASAKWNMVRSGYWIADQKGPNKFVISAEKNAKSGEYPLFFECNGATATGTLAYSDTIEITAAPGGDSVKASFQNPYSKAKKMKLSSRTDDGASSSEDLVAAPQKATVVELKINSEDADGYRTKAVNISANFAEGEAAAPIEFKSGKRMITGFIPCMQMQDVKADGALSEWTGKPCIMDKTWQKFAVKKEAQVGTLGSFWTGYDGKNFYLAVKVNDPKHVQPASALISELWKGDSLQFAFGVDGVRYEFDAALKEDGKICLKQNSPKESIEPKGMLASAKRVGNDTIYEIILPWDLLEVKIDKAPEITFALLVNENDGSGRIGWLEWGEGIGLEKNQDKYIPLKLK